MAKKKVTFTVEESVLKAFSELADAYSINKSSWIEKQMIKRLEQESNEVF